MLKNSVRAGKNIATRSVSCEKLAENSVRDTLTLQNDDPARLKMIIFTINKKIPTDIQGVSRNTCFVAVVRKIIYGPFVSFKFASMEKMQDRTRLVYC